MNFSAHGTNSEVFAAERSIAISPLGIQLVDQNQLSSEQKSALVSVIIPSYNRSWSLGTALKSVYEQDYRPIECIVVDDGSTDDTAKAVERFSADCPKDIALRYLRKENGGANSARNIGLLLSNGEYICYLDSDDRLTPDSISARVDALIKNPGADFSYGRATIVDENGKEKRLMNSHWPKENEAKISAYLFNTNSPMIRRSVCARVGFWREDDFYGQEYEYFSRLKYIATDAAFIDKSLSFYVKHNLDSVFNRTNEFNKGEFKVLLLVKALISHGKYDCQPERKELAEIFRRLAKEFYRFKDYQHSACALFESLSLSFRLKTIIEWIAMVGFARMRGSK